MKKRKTILLAVAVMGAILISFAYGVATVRYRIFPFELLKRVAVKVLPNTSGYIAQKTAFYRQHGQQNYDVVFIGDSLTDQADWNDLFPTLRCANRGISGDQTDGILQRMDSIFSTSATKAVILVGVNDFIAGNSVDAVFENYKEIVRLLHEHTMQVYIQSTILVGQQWADLNPKLVALNQSLRSLSAQSPLTTFVDLNQKLAPDAYLLEQYTADVIHLNANGYAVWRDLLKAHLR